MIRYERTCKCNCFPRRSEKQNTVNKEEFSLYGSIRPPYPIRRYFPWVKDVPPKYTIGIL